ncbi:MAG TPA: HAD family hydrolase, partial [Blastocatellia bacterium]|nr:HAD family hydrolase [Blastocatellia bacterium]
PSEPLLDRVSVRFIVWTGFFKALMGGILLVMMPKWGYSLLATRTGVFVFESIAQLVMAYPSRRISFAPQRNDVLHLAVAVGVVLQVSTIYLPPLRRLLGLEWLDPAAVGIIGAAIVVTWLASEIFVMVDRRLALRAR